MFSMIWLARITFIAAAATLLAPGAHAQKRSGGAVLDDETFLALRDAARRDDAGKAAELAARLPDYVIPSYVEYYRLKPRIASASAGEITDFLQRHAGSAIGDRLRNDWLLELGRTRNWQVFDEQYPQFVLDDDTQLKCYALTSRASKGQNVAEEARALLVAPKNYGEACPALVATLARNGQFTDADVWSQIRLAAETGNLALARRTAALTDVGDSVIAQALDKPSLTVARGPGSGRGAHQAFVVALGLLAKSSVEQAVLALSRNTASLNPQEQALGWAQIALQAARKLAPEAADYWRKAQGAPLSHDGHQWKVRSALRGGDWPLVKSAVEAMPAVLRGEAGWTYWHARALKAEGNREEAQQKFQSIASQTNFYGQLALEELGMKISIPPRAQAPTPEELAPMASNAGFRRAFKLLEMNLRFEGYREWNWELRKMDERQLLAAAEFARQNNLLDRMVNTSDRTRTEFDFTQRFPSPFHDVMQPATQSLGLDMAWVYGLIRQESRFIQTARSHVGASGLMQLMPATARYVARRIGMNDFSQNQVNEIKTNILLGTNYLQMVLNDLDGSQALATAAYNAGPGRPRAWRSTLTRTVEGAVFAETIPFTETRDYVKNVLSNATYYAALFENKSQSLKSRLGTVTPKGYGATDLP